MSWRSLTWWVPESPGGEERGAAWSYPAGPDGEGGPGHRGAPPLVISWGTERVHWGSELIMVSRQVLAVVGGLAAHEHVPVTQDLGLAQPTILEGGSEVSRADKGPCL